MQKRDSQLIFGRNAVLEAIKAGAPIDKLYVAPVEQKGEHWERLFPWQDQRGVPVKDVTGQKLDAMSGNRAHQGVAATTAAAACATMDQVWEMVREKGEKLFF